MEKNIFIIFSEDWLNDKFGATFEQDFWSDPIQRTENLRELQYQTAKRYPDLHVGDIEAKPRPIASDEYAHRFMGALFGCPIRYMKTQAPSAEPLKCDFDDLERLEMPDLHNNEVVKKALDDAKLLKAKYGFCSGGINTGSPLNVAITVFGETFLAACAGEPELAQRVLMIIARTEIRLAYEFSQIVDPQGFPGTPFRSGYGNCPAIMLSPRNYREVVLPVDMWYRQQCDVFNLHHCGIFDRYAELYLPLKPDALDIGGGTDYALLRKHYPDTPASYIVNPDSLEGKSQEEIDAVVRHIVETGGPTSKILRLWSYDISRAMTDENLADYCTSLQRQNLV